MGGAGPFAPREVVLEYRRQPLHGADLLVVCQSYVVELHQHPRRASLAPRSLGFQPGDLGTHD